jgi:tagatose-1,6-bisphosphate aldolase
MNLSIGKWRGLTECSTQGGVFTNLALDHRDSLRRAMSPDDPQSVSYARQAAFKRELVSSIAPVSSAVLLDPEIGIPSAIYTRALPGSTGMLVALEATGYHGEKIARRTEILPGWDVGKVKRIGASGVKLLVYYHPDAPTAKDQEALVAEVSAECARFDLPFFLEPLSYSLDPDSKRLPSNTRRDIVIETARKLSALGVDVLKAEFPLDVSVVGDEELWYEACSSLTEASRTPWVLLSAGVDFEVFLRQVEVACRAGASGVLAGRAVWKEAAGLQGRERTAFLRTTAVERMERIAEFCSQFGRPWWEVYSPAALEENWRRDYMSIG